MEQGGCVCGTEDIFQKQQRDSASLNRQRLGQILIRNLRSRSKSASAQDAFLAALVGRFACIMINIIITKQAFVSVNCKYMLPCFHHGPSAGEGLSTRMPRHFDIKE